MVPINNSTNFHKAMKTKVYNSLGFKVAVLVYASVAEGDQAAGKVDAILDEANDNLAYRGALSEAREAICEALEGITGVKRKTKPLMRMVEKDGKKVEEQAKDKDGTLLFTFDEKEGEFVKRALATKQLTAEAVQPKIDAFFANRKDESGKPAPLAVDIKQPERKAKAPKQLPEKFLKVAQDIIAKGKVDGFAKKYKKLMEVDLAAEATKDATVLGHAIKAYVAKEDEQRLASLAV